MSDLQTLGYADLQALERQIREQKKAIKAARDEFYAEQATDLVTSIVDTETYSESDKSAWAGFGLSAIKVNVNGREYAMSVTLTDVVRKTERAPEFSKTATV